MTTRTRAAHATFAALLLAVSPLAASPAPASDLLEEVGSVPRVDGSEIELAVTRPVGEARVPILLAVDGSLCIPSRLSGWMRRLSPAVSGFGPYALVTVEKPEPTVPEAGEDGSVRIGPDFRCSETFKRYYSIDRRVLDHLRVLAHLRRHADWWDGRLYLWGFSDGARIAGRVGAFTRETVRMVLGGFGGGVPMAEELAEHHVCAPGRTEDRAACLADLERRFDEMRANPTARETWNGDANTWRAWASRLDAVETNLLVDAGVPILVFHGSEDGSVPVSSARRLAERLGGDDGPPGFVYREIEGMGHGLGSGLPAERGEALQTELLAWLLGSTGD